LQLVLDQALAPDVDLRYSSVGDLGRDVLRAVSAQDGARTVLLSTATDGASSGDATRPSGAGQTVPLVVEPSKVTPAPAPAPAPSATRRAPSWRIAALLCIVVLGGLAAIFARPSSGSSVVVPQPTAPVVSHTDSAVQAQTPASSKPASAAAREPESRVAASAPAQERDSGATLQAAPRSTGVAAMTDEIRGHLERAAAALSSDDYGVARREARDAERLTRELREQHPNRETLMAVNRSLSGARRQLFQSCVSARERASEPARSQLRCDGMLRGQSAGLSRRFSER
jgi:hypothetical protein